MLAAKGPWTISTNSQLQEDGSNVDLTQSTPGAAEGGALSTCSWGTPSPHGHFWATTPEGLPMPPLHQEQAPSLGPSNAAAPTSNSEFSLQTKPALFPASGG